MGGSEDERLWNRVAWENSQGWDGQRRLNNSTIISYKSLSCCGSGRTLLLIGEEGMGALSAPHLPLSCCARMAPDGSPRKMPAAMSTASRGALKSPEEQL